MEKDILDRQPEDFNLVVKSIPDCSGAHMVLGVFKGKSVYYMKGRAGNNTLSRCAARNFFIVTNPTAEELMVRQKIVNAMGE